MIELLQLTRDPGFARRCDAIPGVRVFMDLERSGKAQRQAGRNTFISDHQLADIAPVKAVLGHAKLMVRVNPLGADTPAELDAVIAGGADMVMLPMFSNARELRDFAGLVAGRLPIVALLETAGALESIGQWADTPGLHEIFVGLNDLHISLGLRFMFEPLALGMVERAARVAHAHGRRFGFGGIARLDEGLLPGRDVLAEHLRLGSRGVILSRTFHRPDAQVPFEDEIAAIRALEAQLARRTPQQVQADAKRIAEAIGRIAAGLPER